MTPNERFEHDAKRDVQARVREGVKAVIEEALEEETTESTSPPATGSSPRDQRRGERNGHYTRNLLTPAGNDIESASRCPATGRDREGGFVTGLFERYKRM